jgi:nucleoside-diphosphate-sugar epimerase
MRVLVTGQHGYIGTVVTRWLGEAGHDVRGLDSDLFVDCLLGPAPPAVPSIARDIRDVTVADLDGAEAVVHLAALSNDPVGDLAPEHTHDINHHASVRLATLARAAGVERFVYASSCSVYGAADVGTALDEQAPFAPVTAYAESKVRVEDDLQGLAGDGFAPVVLRNATACGFSPRLRCDLVVNDLVARALLHHRVTVLSDGTPWRPLVHVEDIAAVVLASLEAPLADVGGEAFNVGSDPLNLQVRQIAETVAAVVGDVEVEITGEHGSDPRSYRVDFSKIARHLPAFHPAWDLERTVQQLYDAYRRFGLTEEGFGLAFRRLPWLRSLQESGRLDADLRWRVPTA